MLEPIQTKTCSKCKKEISILKSYITGNGEIICEVCRKKKLEELDKIFAAHIKGSNKNKNYRKKYPQKYKAVQIVSHAVERHGFPKANTKMCVKCGNQAEQYHHPDYSKPLEVIPVCDSCHKIIHKNT